MFDPPWTGQREGKLMRSGRILVKKAGVPILTEMVSMIGPEVALQKRLPRKSWNVIAESYSPPPVRAKAHEMLEPVRFRLQMTLQSLAAEPEPQKEKRTDEWTYIDFFNFSTITQTTVGYGDILPNSSLVRCVVVVQVLLGLVLLGAGISWVTTS